MLIGEVARRSGVSARMLRHYESLGLVRPTERTGGGYREYSADDIRRIFHIESLRSLGLSLRDVGRALDDPGFEPAELVAELVRGTRERIAAETELLTRLRRIDAAGPAAWEDVLRTVALLQELGSASAARRQRAALATAETAPLPAEALVEAALGETDPHVAGALRWALARSGDDGWAPLAEGLGSPEAAVRERAVRALAEMPQDEATALLRRALAGPDAAVRRVAAPALGARGAAEAVPVLADMVVAGTNDVEAADALHALAASPAAADRIAAALVERLAGCAGDAPARRRLAQALADIPGPVAADALAELARDEDRGVALTAAYVLRRRDHA
ncbi:HEAT repeat domain-containing protein [Streptomyces genisteinicus]|uniref:MerR family transcriptional regulator n=1 Tax=Streptomyces genisteinicus TaxID=2768068 RepID=A0A7H0I392_9ACTN|nr:HEAT repeat domain-containing protein [Streptomyces genisteinicus]QNP67258.1 MerR family transcriptional regulator [Streptomyces genisteinicus]